MILCQERDTSMNSLNLITYSCKLIIKIGPRYRNISVKPSFPIAIKCLRLPSIAFDCLRLPSIAFDCLRLPAIAFCHLPSSMLPASQAIEF